MLAPLRAAFGVIPRKKLQEVDVYSWKRVHVASSAAEAVLRLFPAAAKGQSDSHSSKRTSMAHNSLQAKQPSLPSRLVHFIYGKICSLMLLSKERSNRGGKVSFEYFHFNELLGEMFRQAELTLNSFLTEQILHRS